MSLLTGGVLLAATEEDEVYFCEDPDGNIILQTDPCPEPVVEEPPPPPEKPKARATEPVPPKVHRPPEPYVPPPPPAARRSASRWTLIPRAPAARPRSQFSLGRQEFPTRMTGGATPGTPSFATPASTWRAFVSALEQDDRAGAGACLTAEALARLGPDVASIPLQELRVMLQRFSRIESGGEVGDYWSIYGVRPDERPKWIFFERTPSGEWKIAGI
jgi:hypothetical protein